MSCEETCCNCGNDIGPHHLCTDCLEDISRAVVHES
jgi:ribosomal protein L32